MGKAIRTHRVEGGIVAGLGTGLSTGAWLSVGVHLRPWSGAVLGVLLTVGAITGRGLPATAAGIEKVFTVGNYPVEAQAADAVAAKAKALADGRKAALRSLVKRLVPVTSYGRLKDLDDERPELMLDGMSVRSERNSSTTYIATLDFEFQADAVRRMLERRGIPFADKAAPEIVLVPLWMGEERFAGEGIEAWTKAWRSVDVEHALTPARVEAQKPSVHADTVKALGAGDTGFIRTFASDYGGPDLILAAVAIPEPAKQQVRVTLIGRDGAGPISWSRVYKLDGADAAYTLELAAVVSLGVLEGRWKAITVKGADTGLPVGGGGLPQGAGPWEQSSGGWGTTITSGAAGGPSTGPAGSGWVGTGPAGSTGDSGAGGVAATGLVQFAVEFNGMAAWADISRRLSQVPGVTNLDVAGLSGRSARVVLRYDGGVERLAEALPPHGLILQRSGRGWVLNAP